MASGVAKGTTSQAVFARSAARMQSGKESAVPMWKEFDNGDWAGT